MPDRTVKGQIDYVVFFERDDRQCPKEIQQTKREHLWEGAAVHLKENLYMILRGVRDPMNLVTIGSVFFLLFGKALVVLLLLFSLFFFVSFFVVVVVVVVVVVDKRQTRKRRNITVGTRQEFGGRDIDVGDGIAVSRKRGRGFDLSAVDIQQRIGFVSVVTTFSSGHVWLVGWLFFSFVCGFSLDTTKDEIHNIYILERGEKSGTVLGSTNAEKHLPEF